MYHPTPDALSLLITIWLVGGWAIAARTVLHSALPDMSSDTALALAFASICAVSVAMNLLAYVLPIPLVSLSLVLLFLPLAPITILARRTRRERQLTSWAKPNRRRMLESQQPGLKEVLSWSLPAVVLLVAAVAAVLVVGVSSTFRTDEGWKTDAVKDLVWANSFAASPEPPLSEEMAKYSGYLTTRAAVTLASTEDASRPSFSWSTIATAGMGGGVFALARALGLGLTGATVSLASMPLLGGDSYRLVNVTDARTTAAALLICGLLLLISTGQNSSRNATAVAGGALCGAAALIHVQFILITGSILFTATLVAYFRRRSPEVQRQAFIVASGSAVIVMLLALPQATTFGPETLQQTAQERATDDSGETPLATGATVWPPQQTELDGIRMIYVSPMIHMMAPHELLEPVWDERTNALITVIGIAALLLLPRRHPGAVLLVSATALVVILVLMNPFIYPVFARLFGIYRTDYIGFEFAFLSVGAVAALARRRLMVGIALAVFICLAAAPVVTASLNHDRFKRTFAEEMQEQPFTTWARVADQTRFGDRLVVDAPLESEAGILCCGHRSIAVPAGLGLPSPFDTEQNPTQVLSRLQELDAEEDIVLLVDPSVPAAAPVWELIRQGAVQPLPSSGTIETGAYYLML